MNIKWLILGIYYVVRVLFILWKLCVVYLLIWFKVDDIGLYCELGEFYIDLMNEVVIVLVIYGYVDYVCVGYYSVYVSVEILVIMKICYGDEMVIY